MMPLTMAKVGEPATIRKITGKDEVRQHLAELPPAYSGRAGECRRAAPIHERLRLYW